MHLVLHQCNNYVMLFVRWWICQTVEFFYFLPRVLNENTKMLPSRLNIWPLKIQHAREKVQLRHTQHSVAHTWKNQTKKLSVPFVFWFLPSVCVCCVSLHQWVNQFFFSLASIPPSLSAAGLLVLKMEYFSYSDRSRPLFFFGIVAYFHISLFDVTKTYLGVVMKPVSLQRTTCKNHPPLVFLPQLFSLPR